MAREAEVPPRAMRALCGACRWTIRDPDEAIETDWRLTLAPIAAAFWLRLARIGEPGAQSGRLDEAIEHISVAARLAPDHPGILNHLGQAFLAAGRMSDAAAAFRRAIAARPERAEGHYNLGALLRQHGDLAEAAASFRRAIAAEPRAAHAHIDLGVTLHSLATWWDVLDVAKMSG